MAPAPRSRHIWMAGVVLTYSAVHAAAKLSGSAAATMMSTMAKKGYPAGYVAVQPLQAGNYTNKQGFLAAGDDIYNANLNYHDAQAWCDQNDECMGFTFQSDQPMPSSPVDVYFKSVANFVSSTGWEAWIKTGPPDIPDVNFTVGGLKIGLRPNSHSIQLMNLVSDPMPPYNFSWVPPLTNFGRNADRSVPGCYQLGDITLRLQPLSETNTTSWALYSSSWAGGVHQKQPLTPSGPNIVAVDDITQLLNATPADARIVGAYPLSVKVVRSYETTNGYLTIRWNVTALSDTRIGGLGFALPADDNTDTGLDRIAQVNSLVDPHIGSDHGWAEWLRITGNQSMMVLPGQYSGPGSMPASTTRFEAWRPLLDDCAFNGGMAEWTVVSGGWASEWDTNRQAPVLDMPSDLKGTGVWGPNPATPWPSWQGNRTMVLPNMSSRYWNAPSTLDLKAGQSASYALRFILAPGGPRTRSGVLAAAGEPVINAVPGYVIPQDLNSSYLLIQPNGGRTVSSISTNPAGILSAGTSTVLSDGTVRVPMQPQALGRVRVSIRLSDGTEAVAHYRVTPAFQQQVRLAGAHWSEVAWLPRDYPDPFGRSSSVMPWDRESSTHVIDDSRAYIVGLSDDAGAAQNLGFSSKVSYAPTAPEVATLDEYIANTLYGVKPDVAHTPLRSLQGRPQDGPDYTDRIRMTVYYYCQNPGSCTSADGNFPYDYPEQDKCSMPVGGPIWCMTENMANATYRGYNWPHSTNVWYAMYRVARFYDHIPTAQPWYWYLERAYALASTLGSPDVGLMDGTVFRELLLALEEEGAVNATIQGWADNFKGQMKARADGWSTAEYPYGSEFNYDTTGQEEVYVWLKYFGYDDAADRTLEAVLGYMRSLPNWAWHGGARSMGDLGNNGLWFVNRGGERVLQHYRSGLNMIPLLEAYRADPTDRILLDVSMGAITGQMTNIDTDGAVSMGFHSFPFVLEHDPRSGDYGLGFFGHTTETGAFVMPDPQAPNGWACFLCNVWPGSAVANVSVSFDVLDAYRARAYLQPLGLQLVAQSGQLQSVQLDLSKASATVTFAPPLPDSGVAVPYSYIRLQLRKEGAAMPGSNFAVSDSTGNGVPVVRGAYQVTPDGDGTGTTTVTVTWSA